MAKLQTVVEGSYGEESTIKVLNYDIDSDSEHEQRARADDKRLGRGNTELSAERACAQVRTTHANLQEPELGSNRLCLVRLALERLLHVRQLAMCVP